MYAPLTPRTGVEAGVLLVRACASHAEGWVLESHSQQTKVVKTGSDNSIAKRLVTGVSVTCPWR